MPLFTTKPTDQLFERFMKHRPNFKPDAPEADRIQAELDAEKERKEARPMIYRDDRHHHTFEKEAAMRPESVSRALLAALYLLTADRNLWSQVRDHISLRRVYVEDMRPKNLTGTSYVYFAAAKDILSGTRNIQLMEIADPALLSMKSYMLLCTALAIQAYGVEKASQIHIETKRMREQYPPGTRVEVVSLCNEEEHLKPGMKGTVVGVDDQPALLVNWDNGSSLSLLIGKDHFRVVPQQEESPGMAMQ